MSHWNASSNLTLSTCYYYSSNNHPGPSLNRFSYTMPANTMPYGPYYVAIEGNPRVSFVCWFFFWNFWQIHKTKQKMNKTSIDFDRCQSILTDANFWQMEDFDICQFLRDANSDKCKFRQMPISDICQFLIDANFWQMPTLTDKNFDTCQFLTESNFWHMSTLTDTNFDRCQVLTYANFWKMLIFDRCHLGQKPNLTDANFDRC